MWNILKAKKKKRKKEISFFRALPLMGVEHFLFLAELFWVWSVTDWSAAQHLIRFIYLKAKSTESQDGDIQSLPPLPSVPHLTVQQHVIHFIRDPAQHRQQWEAGTLIHQDVSLPAALLLSPRLGLPTEMLSMGSSSYPTGGWRRRVLMLCLIHWSPCSHPGGIREHEGSSGMTTFSTLSHLWEWIQSESLLMGGCSALFSARKSLGASDASSQPHSMDKITSYVRKPSTLEMSRLLKTCLLLYNLKESSSSIIIHLQYCCFLPIACSALSEVWKEQFFPHQSSPLALLNTNS